MTLYHYDLCGLDYVYLASGYRRHDTAYGPGISFSGGLDEAIADELVANKPRLTGPEFRHIRLVLDRSQNEIARLMDVSEQTVARWEKGQTALPFLADWFIRTLWRDLRGQTAPLTEEIERLWTLDDSGWNKKVFRYAKAGGWKVAA